MTEWETPSYPIPATVLGIAEHCAERVAAYRAIGRYPNERIKRDSADIEYVVGDASWNRGGRPREFIDDALETFVAGAAYRPRSVEHRQRLRKFW